MRENKGGKILIYYTRRVIKRAEANYSEIEKLGLALVTTHSIVVRTNRPLKATLDKIETSRRMLKWAVELGQFKIYYEPRTAIKVQTLADFIREGTWENRTWMARPQ